MSGTTQAPPPPPQQNDQQQEKISKSEVGWSFVEQYYTFLNTMPHKLHLFYNKSSTVCHGNEGEVVPSLKGQAKIQNRIKEHGFQDCKVMISNVDFQESANDGVVIQVLGEMSNRNEPSQKFVQTFFLAPQPTGYFVLNDIFRFLKEDVEDEEQVSQQQPQPPVVSEEAEVAPTSNTPQPQPQQQQQQQQQQQPKQPETTPTPAPAPTPAATETQAPLAETNGRTEKPEKPTSQPTESTKPAVVQPKKEEKKDQKAASSTNQKATSAEKPASAAPAPTSWAAKLKLTATGGQQTAAAQSQTSPSPSVSPAAPSSTPAATAAAAAPAQAPTPTQKQQQPQQTNGHHNNKKPEYHSAYVKNVNFQVDDALLKQALTSIGKLTHLQIEKHKNRAFVDFIDDETLRKALKIHDLKVGDQVVLIEERKRGGAIKSKKLNKNENNNFKKSGQQKA